MAGFELEGTAGDNVHSSVVAPTPHGLELSHLTRRPGLGAPLRTAEANLPFENGQANGLNAATSAGRRRNSSDAVPCRIKHP